MMGRPPTSSSGLGVVSVNGRRRSPRPPAISTAESGRMVRVAVRSTASASFPEESTTGRRRRPSARARRITAIRISAEASAESTVQSRWATSPTRSETATPRSRPRRMSPSVTVPVNRPSASITRSVISLPGSPLSCRRASSTEAPERMMYSFVFIFWFFYFTSGGSETIPAASSASAMVQSSGVSRSTERSAGIS